MLDFLLENSGVAKSLEPPVTLDDLLRNYCETPEKFSYIESLLEKLPMFANEKLKLSNSVIYGDLPYDSLTGLTKDDLDALWAIIDYLDFPKNLMEKLEPVIQNMTSCEKYKILGGFFDPENTSHWACIGDLEGLKHVHTLGYPLDKLTSTYAAENGHLECLKYAHEHGCPWDEWTCANAAGGGNLECLKYAHEQGCPWDESTCELAAICENLECLVYAHEQGCPWDKETCINAAEYGDCFKYAQEHGCPEF